VVSLCTGCRWACRVRAASFAAARSSSRPLRAGWPGDRLRILNALSTPLRLSVVGTSSRAGRLHLGDGRPLTGGETTALGLVIGFGVLAMIVGYFGCSTIYRRRTVLTAGSSPHRARIARSPPAPGKPSRPHLPGRVAPERRQRLRNPPSLMRLSLSPSWLRQSHSRTPGANARRDERGPIALTTPAPERKPRRRRTPKCDRRAPTEPNSGSLNSSPDGFRLFREQEMLRRSRVTSWQGVQLEVVRNSWKGQDAYDPGLWRKMADSAGLRSASGQYAAWLLPRPGRSLEEAGRALAGPALLATMGWRCRSHRGRD